MTVGRRPLIRVVVSEAAGPSATLGSVLQSEGFLVVGRASSAADLQELVTTSRPDVIVFDAETSALTVLSAKSWAPDTGIVVVWPSGVSAPAADQQVDPSRVRADLGAAVRRAVQIPRSSAAAIIGVAGSSSAATGGRRRPSGGVERRRRDTAPLLVAACAAVLLIASVAVGLRSKQPSIVAQGPVGGSVAPGGHGSSNEPGPTLEARPRVPHPGDLSPSSDPRNARGRTGEGGVVTTPGGNGPGGNGQGGNGPGGNGPGGKPSPSGPGNSSGRGRSDESHGNGNAFGHKKHHGGKGQGDGDEGDGHGNGKGHDKGHGHGKGHDKGDDHDKGHSHGKGHGHGD
jgi:hypothetical protein